MTWSVERASGSAAWLHGDAFPVPDRRLVRVCTVSAPALVLGSTQPVTDVDGEGAAALGVEVVRRRSGGGAVLVEPHGPLWVDLCVPAGDALWCDDVGRAAWWVGEAWKRALDATGVTGAVVHRGGMVRTPWSDRVCFAGLGPGEVRVGDAKVVGISQRRRRPGAVLQSAVLVSWDPAPLVRCLALADRRAATRQLADVAVGLSDLGVGAGAYEVVAALIDRLPA